MAGAPPAQKIPVAIWLIYRFCGGERRKLAHAAARWAFENNKGPRAACTSGLFGDLKIVTRNIVEP